MKGLGSRSCWEAQAHVQRLHSIRRVDHLAHFCRECEERNHSLPLIAPQPCDRCLLGSLRFELVQLPFGFIRSCGPVDWL
jgi:hypothetical protein